MSAGRSAAGRDATDLAMTLAGRLETFVQEIVAGAHLRVEGAGRIGEDLRALEATLAGMGATTGGFLVRAAVVSAATLAVFSLVRFTRRGDGWGRVALAAVAAVLALGIGALLTHLLSGSDPAMRGALRLFVVAACLSGLVLAALDASIRPPRSAIVKDHHGLVRFRALVGTALVWALLAIAAVSAFKLLGAGPGLRDVVGTLGASLPVAALLVAAHLRHRRAVTLAIAGVRPRSARRLALARSWPTLAIALILATVALAQVAATAGRSIRPLALLATVLLILLGPYLDARIKAWAAAGGRSPSLPIALAAARRTARAVLLAVAAALLIWVWGSPVALAVGADLSLLAWPALEVAGVVLVTAYLWNIVGIGIERALQAEHAMPAHAEGEEAAPAPRSRLSTVLPLIGGAARAGLAALALLTVLLALGVNVWPLITGLSVFGLAIGFGSQTLVKDIVSGLFFLADDAFRLGEYIETSGAKGTVEKISIRSVSLRHPRGALATIPYGQIGKIQNFSRDWVIEKLAFRVAFDTDADKVRKLFKRIGQDLAGDPELAPDLIEPFKSQGITAVEDGTLVIRGKFKARAGKQFQLRKRVLAEVHRAFRENEIQAVPKPLMLGEAGGPSQGKSAA